MRQRAFALLITAIALPMIAQAQTVEERARAAAEAAREKSADSEAIQQNYLTPGLAGQSISTVDGTKSFTPNLACQTTSTLLEILAQPGSTGDIASLRISRDKNLDGTVDQTMTLPMPVSGICANGVISCQPGTWNGCRSYKWDVAPAGDLKLAQVDLTALAGCYCVNNSCGSNLVWGNMAGALKDIGGGVVGALTSADPRIGVAQASIDGPVIRYIGAQSTACTASPSLAQTVYRANPAQIQGDAASLASGSSVFQALKASPAGVGRAEQIRECRIDRQVQLASLAFDDIVSASGAFQSIASCGENCRRYRIYGLGTCGSNPPTYTGSFTVHHPEHLASARIVRLGADDWLQVRINGSITTSVGPRPWLTEGLPSGDCTLEKEREQSADIDLTDKFRGGTTTIGARVRSGKAGMWGYIDVEVRVDASCASSERIVDICAGYAADANCQLHDENVDGVQTFRNGVGTGLTPLPQTRLFESGACSLSLVRPWFDRDRRYRCTIDTGVLPQPDLSRGAYIIDHSTETLLADRVKTKDGGYAASSRSFALPDRGSVAACEPICKTRAPKANTGVAPDGVVGSRQNTPSGWDTFYHACKTTSAGAASCPVGDGEELVSDCGCLDDFPEAIVMMQTVRLGGADMICTSESR